MKTKYQKLYLIRDACFIDESGQRWNRTWTRRGVASEFIHHLWKLLKKSKHRKVVLYVRASSRQQEQDGNLDEAIALALETLEDFDCTVIDVFREVAHSSIFNEDRVQLERAFESARANRAILVAPSRDRFLRCESFRKTNQTEPPTIREYLALALRASGVELATISKPDVAARGLQTRRGQRAKGRHAGRPKGICRGPGRVKRRRELLLPLVTKMHEDGVSINAIAKRFKDNQRREGKGGFAPPSVSTVWSWLHRN